MALDVAATLLLAAAAASSDDALVTHRVGRLTIAVDTRHARPGGLFAVDFRSRVHLGALSAIFEGRRAPAWTEAGATRALVPIPLETPPGRWTLGVELRTRRGVQRMTLEVPVGPADYPQRRQTLSEEALARAASHAARRDGRRLLEALRQVSPERLHRGPFRPPVAAPPGAGFGGHEDHAGVPIERLSDGTWGERQRALEYPAAVGTGVGAPAGGRVVMARWLTLTGGTVVVDHGQGLVSALYPLEALAVAEGESVAGGQRLGSSGPSPLGGEGRLEWELQLHGIAVDPRIAIELRAGSR